MITDILICRTEGNICIHTATEADKSDYIAFVSDTSLMNSLQKAFSDKGIDIGEIIWKERYDSDCIMFAIIEISTEKTVGFCEIEHIYSDEPTIGITLAENCRGKGYGYLAAKMMIEEGWKIFMHPYFIWELDRENIASRKLVLKLGGKFVNTRCALSEYVIKVMRENDLDINADNYSDSVERYKIERPASLII